MSHKSIHIVALDVPYPADYGGAIDMYYRIEALYKLGFKIQLHCFEYGRGRPQELEKVADKVFYYSRKKSFIDWLSSTPFIVKTRQNDQLINQLLSDDSPILFEGIHTTFYLADPRLKNRLKIVRTHNIEHHYYAELARVSKELKQLFYRSEARKLKRYESVLSKADHILAIQENDVEHFKHWNNNVHLLPASAPFLSTRKNQETQPYCLFHGNLSVLENENAAQWIIKALAGKEIDLVVAGKHPSEQLQKLCIQHNVQLVDTPSDAELEKLIAHARVHTLYTDQPTGLKLKLLNVLNSSGHIVLNKHMIAGTQLGEFCNQEDEMKPYAETVIELLKKQLETKDFDQRLAFLSKHFDTTENCGLIERLTIL